MQAFRAHRKTIFRLDALLELPFHESVASWEKRLIENALQITGGNKAEAARRLSIHRRLLYKKLEQFGLDAGASAPHILFNQQSCLASRCGTLCPGL